METIPITITFQMIRNKTPDQKNLLKYKDKIYQFATYTFTKADLAKVSRIDGSTAAYIGTFIQEGKEVELHAKSKTLDEIKEILKRRPFVGVLSIPKGKDNDTGSQKYLAALSIAYDSEDSLREVKKHAVDTYLAHSRVKDTQKTALYRWETKYLKAVTGAEGDKKLTMSRINKIAKAFIKHFSLPKDKIHVTSNKTKSASKLGVCKTYRDDITSVNPNFVVLDIFDATFNTLIHEIAHMVIGFKLARGNKVQAHGGEFAGCYAYILSLVTAVPEESILKLMSSNGVKVKPFTWKPSAKFEMPT